MIHPVDHFIFLVNVLCIWCIFFSLFYTCFLASLSRLIQSLVPQDPNFGGRRVVTFHNQRDFIFFRHHRLSFIAIEIDWKKRREQLEKHLILVLMCWFYLCRYIFETKEDKTSDSNVKKGSDAKGEKTVKQEVVARLQVNILTNFSC